MTEKTEQPERWCWSTNEERYQRTFFASREDAIADAWNGCDPGDRFWTGRAVDYTVDLPFDSDDFEERASELAGDVIGEVADDLQWSHEATAALNRKLEAVWEQWKREYQIDESIGIFAVVDIETHEVPPAPERRPSDVTESVELARVITSKGFED